MPKRPPETFSAAPSALARAPRPGSLAAALPPAQRVLDSFFRGLSPRSVQAYREALSQFAGWAESEGMLGADPDALSAVSTLVFSWDALTAHNEVLRYLEWLKEKGLAPNTINHRLSALRSLLRLGRQLGVIPWGLDVRGVRSGKVRDTRGPAVEDVKKLLAYARKTSTRTYSMMLLMFECGLRSVEVRELRMKHLRLESSPPSILVRGKGKTGVTPMTVSEAAREALQRWCTLRLATGHEEVTSPESHVFFRQGRPMEELSRAGLWAVIEKTGKACGVKLWPHALRHSAITEALNLTNGDVRKVQKFSRHAKVETVIAYDDERRDLGGEVTEMLSTRAQDE